MLTMATSFRLAWCVVFIFITHLEASDAHDIAKDISDDAEYPVSTTVSPEHDVNKDVDQALSTATSNHEGQEEEDSLPFTILSNQTSEESLISTSTATYPKQEGSEIEDSVSTGNLLREGDQEEDPASTTAFSSPNDDEEKYLISTTAFSKLEGSQEEDQVSTSTSQNGILTTLSSKSEGDQELDPASTTTVSNPNNDDEDKYLVSTTAFLKLKGSQEEGQVSTSTSQNGILTTLFSKREGDREEDPASTTTLSNPNDNDEENYLSSTSAFFKLEGSQEEDQVSTSTSQNVILTTLGSKREGDPEEIKTLHRERDEEETLGSTTIYSKEEGVLEGTLVLPTTFLNRDGEDEEPVSTTVSSNQQDSDKEEYLVLTTSSSSVDGSVGDLGFTMAFSKPEGSKHEDLDPATAYSSPISTTASLNREGGDEKDLIFSTSSMKLGDNEEDSISTTASSNSTLNQYDYSEKDDVNNDAEGDESMATTIFPGFERPNVRSFLDNKDLCKMAEDNVTCYQELCNEEGCTISGTCIEVQNGYRCTCFPGFEGRACDRREEIPPVCDPNPCTGDCTCHDSSRHALGYFCSSEEGYMGKNCTIPVPRVSCGPSVIAVDIAQGFYIEFDEGMQNTFFYMTTDSSSNGRIPTDCEAFNVGGSFRLTMTLPFSACDSTSELSGDDLIIRNRVYVARRSNLFDVAVPLVDFECRYEREYNLVTSLRPITVDPKTVVGRGHFNPSVELCKIATCPSSCPERYSVVKGAVYAVGEMIYMRATALPEAGFRDYVTTVESAALSCDRHEPGSIVLSLITEGCPDDTGLRTTVSTGRSACIALQTPRAPGCAYVYIHLHLVICDSAQLLTCEGGSLRKCGGRRDRRSISFRRYLAVVVGPLLSINGSEGDEQTSLYPQAMFMQKLLVHNNRLLAGEESNKIVKGAPRPASADKGLILATAVPAGALMIFILLLLLAWISKSSNMRRVMNQPLCRRHRLSGYSWQEYLRSRLNSTLYVYSTAGLPLENQARANSGDCGCGSKACSCEFGRRCTHPALCGCGENSSRSCKCGEKSTMPCTCGGGSKTCPC